MPAPRPALGVSLALLTACGTASDGRDGADGVANAPPVLAAIDVKQQLVGDTPTMQCVPGQDPTDPDGDPLQVDVTWLREGEAHGPGTTTTWAGDTLEPGVAAGGERWSCVMTASDSVEEASVTSRTVVARGVQTADHSRWHVDTRSTIKLLQAVDWNGDGQDDLVVGYEGVGDWTNGTRGGSVQVLYGPLEELPFDDERNSLRVDAHYSVNVFGYLQDRTNSSDGFQVFDTELGDLRSLTRVDASDGVNLVLFDRGRNSPTDPDPTAWALDTRTVDGAVAVGAAGTSISRRVSCLGESVRWELDQTHAGFPIARTRPGLMLVERSLYRPGGGRMSEACEAIDDAPYWVVEYDDLIERDLALGHNLAPSERGRPPIPIGDIDGDGVWEVVEEWSHLMYRWADLEAAAPGTILSMADAPGRFRPDLSIQEGISTEFHPASDATDDAPAWLWARSRGPEDRAPEIRWIKAAWSDEHGVVSNPSEDVLMDLPAGLRVIATGGVAHLDDDGIADLIVIGRYMEEPSDYEVLGFLSSDVLAGETSPRLRIHAASRPTPTTGLQSGDRFYLVWQRSRSSVEFNPVPD